MHEPALSSDAVTALPGTTATAMAWRTAQGQLHLTAIVKATFAFAPDSEMPVVAPQPIFRGEVHHGNNPIRGIRFASDLAPYLGRADVMFTGHAYAPRGTRAQSMHVRLAVADSRRILLDRQLLVRDRDGFERMPLTCDRAASGVDGQENPFGRGPDPAAANIVDPRDPSRPAGFGPIARALPARRRRLGATPRKALEAPIVEIPDGFDWGYFQAAPEGQQIDHLRGDEWILLEGLHPSLPRLAMRLPGARGAARIHGLGDLGVAEGMRLDLVADTLHIDGEDQRCTVVWRRSFPLPHAGALAAVRIVAGVELAGIPVAWAPPQRATRAEATAPVSSQRGRAGTIVIAEEEPASGARPTETAFLQPDEAEAASCRTVIPFQVAAAPHAATVALGPDEDAAASVRRALPFERASGSCAAPSAGLAPVAASPPAATAPLSTDAPPAPAAPLSTFALSPDDDARASASAALPFPALPTAIAEGHPARPAPILGAPWSTERALFALSAPPASCAPAPPSAPPPPSTPPAASAPPSLLAPSALPAPSSSLLSAPLAKAPPAPPEDTADIGVERYATIAAQLSERRASRADVLGAHGLSEARFGELERRWTAAMDDEDRRGGHALRDAYDAAYVKEWEAHRRPFELADYARLAVAAERGHLAAALDSLGIRRTLWVRLKRVWARRLAESRSLAGGLQRELARQRELRSTDAHRAAPNRMRAPGS
ncbi:DUF2169 domain-containing protein [Sorangium cellulosum]|uniref:DUF2169 family type VI secretion system accessory protein n=1 Tax=Sorangium cellulosum TaxID=56 RepID=UPI003D9A7C91